MEKRKVRDITRLAPTTLKAVMEVENIIRDNFEIAGILHKINPSVMPFRNTDG